MKIAHLGKATQLAGRPADAHIDEALLAPIKMEHNPAFEANVRRVKVLIYDLDLPDDVKRGACPDSLLPYSLVVIQTAAARVKFEKSRIPQVVQVPTFVPITAGEVSNRVEALGMTRRAFAFECDMLPNLLSQYLNGNRHMSPQVQRTFVAVLHRLEATER